MIPNEFLEKGDPDNDPKSSSEMDPAMGPKDCRECAETICFVTFFILYNAHAYSKYA